MTANQAVRSELVGRRRRDPGIARRAVGEPASRKPSWPPDVNRELPMTEPFDGLLGAGSGSISSLSGFSHQPRTGT